MLEHTGLELEGKHHSGVDDCKNMARIVRKMLQGGWEPKGVTGTYVAMNGGSLHGDLFCSASLSFM